MATRKTGLNVRHEPRRGRNRTTTRLARGPGIVPGVVLEPTGNARERRRAEKLVARVDALRDQITVSFYQMGLALRDLARPETYGALGYRTFVDLLEAREITSRPTAMKLIAVVDALEEDVALELGIEKSYAFIRYVRTVRPNATVTRLAARNPVIAGTRARLADISVRDLRELTKSLASPRDVTPPRRLQTTARKLGRALRAQDLDPRTVTVARSGSESVVRVELTGEDAAALAEMLGS